MDNFIDSFLSSTSWSNGNSSTNRTWIGSVASQADSLLANPMESYQRDGKISPMSLMHSNHIMENVSADTSEVDHDNTPSSFDDGSLKYGSSKALFLGGNLLQSQQPNLNSQPSRGVEGHGRKFSTPGQIGCNSTAVSYGAESNVTLSHNALTISNSLASNGREPPAFGQSLEEAHSLPSAPAFWTPTYSNISHLNAQEKVENFSFQGMANGADYLGKGATELPNLQLPSFTRGSQMPFGETIGILANQQAEGTTVKQQMSHSSSSHQQMAQANSASCNAATKPRVRARRGQATDPHSIAERLRREKIAERMKNLQELVPNSNKTDKASMLDEIIDYVKFLQLQVKVLSMSRLGGAGAVVPLITDAQTEDTGSLHSSTVSQGIELLESQDNLAFEHEVVKLMESNVTSAMQFLQNKGLCLMPIALASAISNQKGSVAAIPPDRRQPDASERSDHGDEVNRSVGVVVKREEEPKSIGNGRQTKL